MLPVRFETTGIPDIFMMIHQRQSIGERAVRCVMVIGLTCHPSLEPFVPAHFLGLLGNVEILHE